MFDIKYVPLFWTTFPFWIAVLLNIFVVSLFETLFYFLYVTGVERSTMIGDVDRYTDLMSRQMYHITNKQQKEDVMCMLSKRITALDDDMRASVEAHKKEKHSLFVRAIVYELVIFGALLVVTLLSLVSWYVSHNTLSGWVASLHLGHIMTELIMVLVLYVVFDFVYVHYIAGKWQSMTATDFQRNIVKGSGIETRTTPTLKKMYDTMSKTIGYLSAIEPCA
jgi:hypothetical protein